MPRTFVWNEAEPDGTEPAEQLDEIINGFKQEVRELLNQVRGAPSEATTLEDPLRILTLLVGASPPAGSEIARIAGSIRVTAGSSLVSAGALNVTAEGANAITFNTNAVARLTIASTGAATFTGTLTANGDTAVGTAAGTARFLYIDSAAGNNRQLAYRTGTSLRWVVFTNSAAESGANAGSDFRIDRYADGGTFLGNVVEIVRSTGLFRLFAGASISPSLIVGTDPGTSAVARFGGDVTTSGSLTFTSSAARVSFGTTGTDHRFRIGGTPLALEVVRVDEADYLRFRAAEIYANNAFFGNGANITALNAANVSSGTLAIARGGLGVGTTPANGAIPIGTGTGYNVTTITAGSNITITNASGSITIAASGAGVTVSGAGSTTVFNFVSYSAPTLTLTTSSLSQSGTTLLSTYLNHNLGGNVFADITLTRDLGTSLLYWRNLYVGASVANRFNQGTVSGSFSLDFASRTIIRVELTANASISSISNVAVGQSVVLEVVQGGVGNFTLGWPTSAKFSDNVVPQVGLTAGRKTTFVLLGTSASTQIAAIHSFNAADIS